MKTFKTFFFLLIILWIIISSYLTFLHYSETTGFCNISENSGGCNSVLKSEYSEFLGIPIAVFGIIFYITTLITFSILVIKKQKIVLNLLLILQTIWLAFSMFFTYLQFFVIKTFCPYCLTSAIIVTILFILTIFLKKNWKKYLFMLK